MEERRRNTDTQIDILTERVNNWMATTEDYRKALCTKNDRILIHISQLQKSIDSLPCPTRVETTNAMKGRIGWLEKGAIAIISCLFMGGVWVGNINTTTNAHEARVKTLETIEREAQKIRSTNVSKISQIEKLVQQR